METKYLKLSEKSAKLLYSLLSAHYLILREKIMKCSTVEEENLLWSDYDDCFLLRNHVESFIKDFVDDNIIDRV